MDQVITIGLDLAKSVFQVHGVDASGTVVVRRQLRRDEVLKFFRGLAPCLVGMEACGSAHHWARAIGVMGHRVRLLPACDVKPYVKRGRKNDAADAAAICEAVNRPHLHAVPVKSEAQQGVLLLHRTRDLLVRQRTMLICALRSHLAEFGIVAAQGKGGFAKVVASLERDDFVPKSESRSKLLNQSKIQISGDSTRNHLALEAETGAALPRPALDGLRLMAAQIDDGNEKIEALEKAIVAEHRGCEASRRLASIPGIGPIIASALAASVPDPSVFENGRQLAAWLGLVPRQNSSGGKERLGGITKTGDRSLRRLLVIGATGLIRYKRQNIPGGLDWVTRLLAHKPVRLVTVALANKMARIAWAVLVKGEAYREVKAAA